MLSNGQLVMVQRTHDDQTRILVAYPLPGYREATHGWTSARGNSQRTRSPR